MKKNIIYSLLLVVAVLFAGCEDRLDIAKHGNMGGQDDFYKSSADLRRYFDEKGYKYTYLETEGGHIWRNWRVYLTEFAQKIFK